MSKTIVLKIPNQGLVSFKIESNGNTTIISNNTSGKFKEIGRSNTPYQDVVNSYLQDRRFHKEY